MKALRDEYNIEEFNFGLFHPEYERDDNRVKESWEN